MKTIKFAILFLISLIVIILSQIVNTLAQEPEKAKKVKIYISDDGEKTMDTVICFSSGDDMKNLKEIIKDLDVDIDIIDEGKMTLYMTGDSLTATRMKTIELITEDDEIIAITKSEAAKTAIATVTTEDGEDIKLVIKRVKGAEDIDLEYSFITDDEGDYLIYTTDDKDMKKIIVKTKGSGEDDESKDVFVWKAEGDDDIIKMKKIDISDDNEFIFISGGTHVEILDPDDKDYKSIGLEKCDQDLDIKSIILKIRDDDGKVDLVFKAEKANKCTVSFLDSKGEVLFKDKLKDFSGKYDDEIDLNIDHGEVYLYISQNNACFLKKIILN